MSVQYKLGKAWLNDHSASIVHGHLQFEKHLRLEMDSLLAQATLPGRFNGSRDGSEENLVQRATGFEREYCHLSPAADSAVDLKPIRGVEEELMTPRRLVPQSVSQDVLPIGDGVADAACGEWIAQLTQQSDVVVSDVDGRPSPIGVAKALSIIQSLGYLKRRAIQLLSPLSSEAGVWTLVTLDFGLQAQSHKSEFLLCFAFDASDSVLSTKSPYAEIGFSLMVPKEEEPLFILTVKTAVGLRQ